jgi:tetratricopeptide (TPR) repeat protein
VQAVIGARVDRLDADTLEVLRLASVIGTEFGRRTLEQLFPDQARLDQALDKVVRLDLVQPLRVVPEAAWLFKHALVQEVVYETILLERRREIHDLVGAILETIHSDRIEEHYESLAHHFSHGSRTEKAVEYLGKSGDKAARYFCLRESRGYYNQAIELLEGTPLDNDGKRRYIAIASKWADGSFYSASARNMVALDRALAFAVELGEPGLETQITFEIARIRYSLGDMRQAREAFLDFEKRMQSEPNSLLLARARVVFSIVNLYLERFDEGIDALRKALPVLNAADSPADVCWAHGMLGSLLGAQGLFRASRGHMDKAYALAISLQNKTGQAQTRAYSSVVSLWQGKIRDALSDAEEAVREGTRIENSVITSYGLAMRGFALVLQGNRKEGLEDIEHAIEVVRETGTTLGTSFFLGLLSEAHALVGNFQESRRAAREYGKLLELGIHYGEIGATRALGICAARTGDPGWQVHFNRAIELSRATGSRPELAISHFRYAEALAQLEHMQRATQELDLAESLFREMEMQWWPDRASELRAKLGSPKDQL